MSGEMGATSARIGRDIAGDGASVSLDARVIEEASTLIRGRTLFAGTVSVLLGDANDSLRIAFPAGPFLGAVFQSS